MGFLRCNTVNGQSLSFGYDIDGIRSSKTVNGQTTRYLTDHNTPYARVVYESNGVTGTQYRYGLGNQMISQSTAGQDSYYLHDALGSTKALTDATGTLTDSYAYDAYGDIIARSGSTSNAYQYAGEQYDADLGLYYNRARYYDQSAGRFSQMDSYLGRDNDPITLNKYAYANANPVMYTDPSGQMGLGDVSLASNLQASLMQTARYGGYLLNAYDKVQLLVGLMDFATAVRQVMGQSTVIMPNDMKYSGLPSTHGKSSIPVDFSEAAESFALNLPRVVGVGIGDWERGYLGSQRKGSKLSAFLIHMPIISVLPDKASNRTPSKVVTI